MPSRNKPHTFVLAAISAAIVAAVVWTGPLTAQPGHRPTAEQLKRLAAAVDGYRLGVPVWVVMRTDSLLTVDSVALSQEDAVGRVRDLGGDPWRWFGPYETEAETVRDRPVIYYYCHDWDSDRCGPMRNDEPLLFEVGDSIRVEITRVEQPDTVVLHLPITSVDAVFFNVAAVEKFMVPYWVSIHGAAVAAGKLEEFRAEMIRRLGGGG